MKSQIAFILMFLLSVKTNAQNTESANTTKPGNPALISSEAELQNLIDASKGNYKYKVEDYFSIPKSSNFQLSPGGKYLCYKERNENGKTVVRFESLQQNI